MTAQEKAKELKDKFFWKGASKYPEQAKTAALIAVDEILYLADRVSDISNNYFRLTSSGNYGDADKELEYWQQVKQEIQKL